MSEVLLLNQEELSQCVKLNDDSIKCIEDCFRTLGTKPVVMPPIMRLDIEENNGEVDVKTAYLPGVDSFAIKISPGFFDNPKIGLPSVSGMMVLFSAKTGVLEAVLLDKGYLTDVRTAAAGAVAAKWLSRENSTTAAIIGAGVQARLQLQALMLVRDIESCTVWARDFEKSKLFANSVKQELGIDIQPCESIQDACVNANIIVTTTPSTEPLLKSNHLHPGQHVTAMGSDAEHKNELSPKIIKDVDRYVCDKLSQVSVLGELHHAIADGFIQHDQEFDELGKVIAGHAPGRENDNQITVCDLTGTGAQDTAIATYARKKYESAIKA